MTFPKKGRWTQSLPRDIPHDSVLQEWQNRQGQWWRSPNRYSLLSLFRFYCTSLPSQLILKLLGPQCQLLKGSTVREGQMLLDVMRLAGLILLDWPLSWCCPNKLHVEYIFCCVWMIFLWYTCTHGALWMCATGRMQCVWRVGVEVGYRDQRLR